MNKKSILIGFFSMAFLIFSLLIYVFYTRKHVEFSTIPPKHIWKSFENDKQKFLSDSLEKIYPNQKNLSILSKNVATIKSSLYKTLAKKNKNLDSPLIYSVHYSKDKKHKYRITEHTKAEYFDAKSIIYEKVVPDFNIAIASFFGMNVAFYKPGKDLKKISMYKKTFTSIVYNDKKMLFYAASPSDAEIIEINPNSDKVNILLKGFRVYSMQFNDDILYFVGIDKKDNHGLYKFNIKTSYKPECIFNFKDIIKNNLNDYRGLLIFNNKAYISITPEHKIVVINLLNKKAEKIISGFSFPNAITLSPDKLHIYVSDEHCDTIRKLTIKSFDEVWRLPFGLTTSPSKLIEIEKGKFKGNMIISDTDHNRIIMINKKNDILFEITGLRACLDFEIF